MEITVKDIVDIMVDERCQKVEVWDINEEMLVFSGFASEIPEKYLSMECSIDTVDKNVICFNVI